MHVLLYIKKFSKSLKIKPINGETLQICTWYKNNLFGVVGIEILQVKVKEFLKKLEN